MSRKKNLASSNTSNINRKLTTINGVDYWDAYWQDHVSNRGDNTYDIRFSIRANEDYNKKERKRIQVTKNIIFILILSLAPIIFFGLFFLSLQLDFPILIQIIASLVITTFIFPFISTLIDEIIREFTTLDEHRAPEFFDQVNFNFYGEGRGKPGDITLTKQMARDLSRQLNVYRENGDVEEYMKIVRKIIDSDKKRTKSINEEKKREALRKELKENSEFAKRNVNNPFLNDSKIIVENKSLLDGLDLLNSKPDFKNRVKLKKLEGKLNELQKMSENNKVFDGKAFEDCRRELETVTNQFNETLEAGLEITDDEVADYQKLVNNCTIILDRVSRGAIEQRSTDSKIANIFLKDKYGVSSTELEELERELSEENISTKSAQKNSKMKNIINTINSIKTPDKINSDKINAEPEYIGDTKIINGKWNL